MNTVARLFNGRVNQISIGEGTTETFQSYQTLVATFKAASAVLVVYGGSPYRYSTTTSRNFNDWMEWVCLRERPTRKQFERWMEQGYIPSMENVYNTDIDIVEQ